MFSIYDIEILRIKSEFTEGLQGLTAYYRGKTTLSPKLIQQALNLIEKILRGTYRYSNGEEQIVLEKGKYVKINFSSSGQQECVWILNLLFYYLLQQNPILFIIEEPESHLFPESQKYITELIALVSNWKHSVVLTTHSPYVLGTLNNLDKGNPQYHKGINSGRVYVSHYKIDGVVIKSGNRCDYLLMNEVTRTAYLIELKGSDLIKAAKQLEATAKALNQQLSSYSLQYRIVANKCRTQEIKDRKIFCINLVPFLCQTVQRNIILRTAEGRELTL